MATEGRILTAVDVAGGNPVRTVVQSTQANDEGAPSNKDAQVMVIGDPNTPANLLAVDSLGRSTTIAATYTRSSAGVWTAVGYQTGDLNLPVSQRDTNTSRSPLVSTFQALNAVPLIGLVNSTFYTTTSVTDNYTVVTTGTGTATVTLNAGYAVIASGTTNPSSVQITSKDYATYNGIGELMFLNGLRNPQFGGTGVIKRWGAYDDNNGYFFEDNTSTFRVVSRKGGVDTAIASGSFNGLIGTTWTNDFNAHFFQILMTGGRAVFMIDQVVLHTLALAAGTTTTSGSLNLPIRIEIISTQTANMTLELRGQNIGRLGTVDSKRLNEGLLDNADSELVRAVPSAQTGTANTYVNQTATVAGTKNSLDINIASSSGGVAAVSQAITAAVANTPGSAVTASTSAQAVANVTLSGNSTFHLVAAAFVGTVNFEASLDGGFNYAPVMAVREDGSGSETGAVLSIGSAFIRTYSTGLPGFTHFRIRCSAFTSGTLAVYLTQGPFLLETNPSLAASSATIGAITPVASVPLSVTGATIPQTPPGSGGIGTVYATGTTTFSNTLVSAPGAGLSIYVTDMWGSNSGAAGSVTSFYESAGSTRFSAFMAASGGGFVTNLGTPWKLQTNVALGLVIGTATTYYVTVNYYIAP